MYTTPSLGRLILPRAPQEGEVDDVLNDATHEVERDLETSLASASRFDVRRARADEEMNHEVKCFMAAQERVYFLLASRQRKRNRERERERQTERGREKRMSEW